MRELKKQILFSLATISPDLILLDPTPPGTLQVAAGVASVLTYPQLQWRVGEFEASSVRGAISGLRTEGAVTTLQREATTRIRLTTVGRELLFSFVPSSLFRRRRWDETWRVAIFSGVRLDTKTEQRYRILRKVLSQRGFAALERGVYISPYALQTQDLTTLSQHKTLGLLTVLETKRFILGDERGWCNQVWNLEKLSNEYTKLSALCVQAIAQLNSEKTLNQRSKEHFRNITAQLLQIMSRDPGLPQQLLPEEFGSHRCWKAYVDLGLQMLKRE